MLIPLLVVISLGVFFTALARRESRIELPDDESASNFSKKTESPLFFENPRGWLAIKIDDPAAVQAALRLHHGLPCSWSEWLERAAEEKLFVAPPIDGWILVFGAGLPEPADDIDAFHAFIMELSKQLGLVLYFNAQPVFYHHAWIKVLDGRVVRAYAWADEALWNQGDLTQAEHDLRLRCRPYGDQSPVALPQIRDAARRNCEKVSSLAARWSIDPNSIDAALLNQETGIAGEFSQSKFH